MDSSNTGLELYANDFQVGDIFTLGSYYVSEAEIIEFACQWDPQFFHTTPRRAGVEGHFNGLIASGIHTLGIFQRLWVLQREHPWNVIGGSGIDHLRFPRPVRPGDTLTGTSGILKIQDEPERKRALVTFDGKLRNQDNKSVLTLSMSVYLLSRPTQVAGGN